MQNHTILSDQDVAQPDRSYELNPSDVAGILDAVDREDRDQLVAQMEPLHAADIADLLEQIDGYDRARLIRLYEREFDGEILSELNEAIREDVINLLKPEVLADAVRDLESDDVVDLLEDLETPQQEAILDALDDIDRLAVEQSLAYPEFSAGRLMQREVVAAPDYWTVGDAIEFMRKAEELPEQFYHVILVDPKFHPVGNVTLGRIMSSKRSTALVSLKEEMFRVIPADQDEAEVAYAFNQYHLISAPVVDHEQRLVGMITIDDAMMVLDHEHEEDILRLAGVGESSLSDTVLETAKQRLPWLGVNLFTAILASVVIALALVGGEPVYSYFSLCGHRAIRSSACAIGGFGDFNAHCGLDGRQCGHAKPDGCGACDCDQRSDPLKSGSGGATRGSCGAFKWGGFRVGNGLGRGDLVRIPRAWICDRVSDGDQFGCCGFGWHRHSGSAGAFWH